MSQYVISAFIAFIVFGMGILSLVLGFNNYFETGRNKKSIAMLSIFVCVFVWDLGYAWMSLSFEDEWAYIFRALALFAITIYMVCVLKYVSLITNYPQKRLNIFLIVFLVASLTAWTRIIKKDAIDFVSTAWGYWYTSKMSWARVVQFASIMAALGQYYFILRYGRNRARYERQRYILRKFEWFGVIVFIGYVFDTLLPTLIHTPAMPGSSVSAFFSTILLYGISRNNKAFGLSKDNISEYVFQDVSIPVIITDSNKKILLCNDITKDYLECAGEEILQKNMYAYFEPFVSDEKISFDVESNDNFRYARVINSSKICKFAETEVMDRFDELLYSIYFVQDITKEREMLNMLQESRAQAEEANLAKSNFLANISHEIRTPINAVLGLDELILRESKNDTIIAYAKDIEAASKNLLSLINDVLDISKIESGNMSLVLAEYDLASLLYDSYNTVYLRAREKNLTLDLENEESIPSWLYGDEVRVRQILTNLLTNAVKYTKVGSVHIKVDYRKVAEDTIDLIISVKDTGIGLNEKQKAELFDNFKRFDEKENRNIEGTGLGLSITKNFVDMMNGEIIVESEKNVGSVFTVIIPQKIVKHEPVGNINERMGKIGQEREQYKETLIAPDVNILVVDDVEMNIKVFKGLLKQTRINVDSCLSGEECLVAVKKKKYDIIFMDHMMPVMDGVEAFHHIRQDGDNLNEDTPVIMLTANAVISAEEGYIKEGFDDYLSKPVQWTLLEEMIKKYIPVGANKRENKTDETDKMDEKEKNIKMDETKNKALINEEIGLSYCGNIRELYVEVLNSYLDECKLDALNEFYANRNWEDYKIKAHALKSTSLTIGAVELSDEAKALEQAIIDGNIDYVVDNHKEVMEHYQAVLDKVKAWLGR